MSEANIVNIRAKNTNLKKSRSKNTLDESDLEHKINSLDELVPSDHIVILEDLINEKYCHAILESVNPDKNIIEIIYYDDTQTQCSLDEYMVNPETCERLNPECDCRKVGVKRSTLEVDFKKIEIYKVDYDFTKETILLPNETLEKARKCIGQTKYNIFENNDEHFCIYCKTGKAGKLFIVNPKDINAKNIIGKELSEKIVGGLAQQGGQILLVNTAKHIATKFPRAATAALPAAAEAAGSVIGVGIESISMGIDLYRKHKDFKEGKVSEMKFKKYIARRVTRGTMGVAGGIAGGIIGQMVIPVPVVGAVIGSLVGGIVGAAVGQGEGILLGELVEVIDNKIKEKKETDLENELKKSKSEEKIIDNNFNVIDKLVYKFDKNILKPENYAHLSDVKIEALQDNADDKVVKIIENAQTHINDEDYEIYMLDDSKEIVNNLNIESVLDENGVIDKRKSIEALPELPANINVFFKILEKNENSL